MVTEAIFGLFLGKTFFAVVDGSRHNFLRREFLFFITIIRNLEKIFFFVFMVMMVLTLIFSMNRSRNSRILFNFVSITIMVMIFSIFRIFLKLSLP